ncbi:MAG: toll/interleukin-1 receptor domain-containing protein [Gammaproteobacteria bacterium]|nr:toll/interleukin-1 receptor domain-containing protein [Gammaproteobacteria bacterium]
MSGAEASAPRYCAFISYSHQDKAWAHWLHSALEAYVIPKEFRTAPEHKRLGKAFRDEAELASSADLSETIQAALAQSEALIVIASPAAARSPWVNQEILAFKRLGRAARVFCLIVEGQPFAGDAGQPEQECFPPALRHAFDAERGGLSEQRQEPLGVDVRKDSKRDALLRLAAGLLDLGFDDLKRREQHRRQRQMAWITLASLAGMLFTSGLAWYAYQAEQEATRQRKQAQHEAAIAKETTGFLISIFQDADPLRVRGEKITVREVLDRGLLRINQSFRDAPEIRSSLLGSMGDVYQGLGLYQTSKSLYQQLEAPELQAALPSEKRLHFLNAQAEIDLLMGDYARAKREAERIESLLKSTPQREEAELIRNRNIQAEIALRSEAPEMAGPLLSANLSLPLNNDGATLKELARSHFNQGILHWARHDNTAAGAAFSQALALRKKVFGDDHPLVSEAEYAIATNDYNSGRYLQAEQAWAKLLPRYRSYVGDQHPDYASLLHSYALTLLERGAFAEAKQHFLHTLAIDRREKAADHDDLAYSLNSLGLAELGLNNPAQARQYWQEGLGIARKHQHRMRAPLLLNLADLECREGHAELSPPLLAEAEQANAADYAGIAWRTGQLETVRLFCAARRGETVPTQAFDAGIAAIEAHWGKARLYTEAARWRQAHARPEAATLKEAPATKP